MTILVIDLGSSSVRALLFDRQARAIPGAVSSRSHAFTTTPPGAATASAATLRTLTEQCLDEILTHPAATGIRAVGLDTFGGNLLGLDAQGNPITPVYTYADSRSAPDVEQLESLIDPAATHQRTGCQLHPAYHPRSYTGCAVPSQIYLAGSRPGWNSAPICTGAGLVTPHAAIRSPRGAAC
ncbi:MAG: FGGY family carbohydrate kinase [Anaerolineae bacterium]|nr:FGGY family carbohydrate kinase [Anaerolineae bacterium]